MTVCVYVYELVDGLMSMCMQMSVYMPACVGSRDLKGHNRTLKAFCESECP